MPTVPEIEELLADPELQNLYSDFVLVRLRDGEVKPFASGMHNNNTTLLATRKYFPLANA